MFKHPKLQNPDYSVQARELSQYGQFKGAIKRDTRTALVKFRYIGRLQICLGVITVAFGAALVAVSASNVGPLVFNVGPLLTGLVELAAGILALMAARREVHKDEPDSKIHTMIKVHFGLNTLVLLGAGVSLVVAGMACALCAGWENQFYYLEAGARYEHHYREHCYPYRDAKIALSAVNAVVCGVVFLWNCYAVCIYCAYGAVFGLAYRRF